jgi:phosphopantetheine adenylyltransferase
MANGIASTNLSSLLLLPSPPSPISAATLKAAYEPSLTAALTELSSLNLFKPVLEILLPCPGLLNRLQEPRSQHFEKTQHLLAGVYSLICVVCAKNSIKPDWAGGVDYRIILLAHEDTEDHALDDDSGTRPSTRSGPIIDLPTFALTRRNWHTIFSVDGEKGEGIFKKYLNIANRQSPPVHGVVHKVAGGISIVSRASENRDKLVPAAVHSVVAVGGTFDHLHTGHKLLLTATALMLQPGTRSATETGRMIVGITGDELLKNKKYAEHLLSWERREEEVIEFMTTILSFTLPGIDDVNIQSFDEPKVNGRAIYHKFKSAAITVECYAIQDAYGPTTTDESVSAIVVSGETRGGGAAVNTKREEKGWKGLEVFEVDVLDATEEKETATGTDEFAAKISSSAIRKQIAEQCRL